MNKIDSSITNSNIVLSGSFDVTKLDRLFFIKNKIVNEDELNSKSLQGSNFEVSSKQIKFIITPKQIVVSFLNKENIPDLIKISTRVINLISENNTVIAMGVNFYWVVEVKDGLKKYSRDLFANTSNPMFEKFLKNESVAIGTNVTMDIEDGKFRLDIKPQNLVNIKTDEKLEGLYFIFNYHFDVTNKDLKQFGNRILARFSEYYQTSLDIIKNYE